MTKLQKEYLDNIMSSFRYEVFYEDQEFYGTENTVTYRQFLDKILASRECDRIMDRIELEFHKGNDKTKFTRSNFIEGYFEHVYGTLIPLNQNADALLSQIMSPGFAFLCLNYLKTGKIHLPLTESEKSQIEIIQNKEKKTQKKSGCMLLFSVIIMAITLLIHLN